MDAVSTIPIDFNFDEAAAITEGAHYALVNIRSAKVQAGQNVLVYGATGAIGSAAVQLLKTFWGQCNCSMQYKNLGLVKSFRS